MKPVKKIRLFWDFRGPSSQQTALHFQEHLEVYLNDLSNKQELNITEVVQHNEAWASCALDIDETQLDQVKSALKPNRGNYL
jgi:hypothetical protein